MTMPAPRPCARAVQARRAQRPVGSSPAGSAPPPAAASMARAMASRRPAEAGTASSALALVRPGVGAAEKSGSRRPSARAARRASLHRRDSPTCPGPRSRKSPSSDTMALALPKSGKVSTGRP
ncbi:hypothetical protein ACFQFG_20705 [Methylobacterium persicinum]